MPITNSKRLQFLLSFCLGAVAPISNPAWASKPTSSSNCASKLTQSDSEQSAYRANGRVGVQDHRLWVDGKAIPQVFSAEVQYFRLRGAYQNEVPAAEVQKIWARALDAVVDSGMSAVSFYIPWDFHEVSPGNFDFDGSTHPARNLKKFIEMIRERNLKIMFRPGPYINAEWGHMGFGSAPEWFSNLYPQAHMRDSQDRKTKVLNYHHPVYLEHVQKWFIALHQKILKDLLGPDSPIVFLQLDNETNYMWQSIFNHNYSEDNIVAYRRYLKEKYGSIQKLNLAHHIDHDLNWKNWQEVQPARVPDRNVYEDQEWFRFQDERIYTYLQKLRAMWEALDVKEPDVQFILAESYNAQKNGLLPNFKHRSSPGKTGALTINLYPKTFASDALIPAYFKILHDAASATAANARYYGNGHVQQFLMSPESGTGWFLPTVVSDSARQQMYLDEIGSGIKWINLYYFSEGFNYKVEWAQQQLKPYYDKLKNQLEYVSIPMEQLDSGFWEKLQEVVNQKLYTGMYAKNIMQEDPKSQEVIRFGAPLDEHAHPTQNFELVKRIGTQVIRPFADLLSKMVSVNDPVAILVDQKQEVSSGIAGLDSNVLNSIYEPALMGYLMHAGVNPSIHHWNWNRIQDLSDSKVILVQDSGNLDPEAVKFLAKFVRNGGTVVSFVGDSVAKSLGIASIQHALNSTAENPLEAIDNRSQSFKVNAKDTPVISYSNLSGNVQPILHDRNSHVLAYRADVGKGHLFQVGSVIYGEFNTEDYAKIDDVVERRNFLEEVILKTQSIRPQIDIKEGHDRVVAFGRKLPQLKQYQNDPDKNNLWITVKNANRHSTHFHVTVASNLLDMTATYTVKDVLGQHSLEYTAQQLSTNGFEAELDAEGSTAFYVQRVSAK